MQQRAGRRRSRRIGAPGTQSMHWIEYLEEISHADEE
jgi:hypothetical protein